jgi:two-component system phosphate regulon sensor histidine kinase PhoR
MKLKTMLNDLIEHPSRGILVCEPSGKIIRINQQMKTWLKQEKTKNKISKTDYKHPYYKKIYEALKQRTIQSFEWNQQGHHFESSIQPMYHRKKFVGFLVVTIDETKMHNIEQIQSDFLADISHEFKTPLAAILGASEILTQSIEPLSKNEQQEFQQIIANESARLKRLINELTDLSKIGTVGFETLKRKPISLANLLNKVGEAFKYDLSKKHIFYKVLIHSKITVEVDEDKFFQIFANLLSNAIRYTNKGGITITHQASRNQNIVYFKDSGSGIKTKSIDRIFDRFYRTDTFRNRSQGGSGLGLAITRAIVEAHHGKIEVRSELGKGTTFIVSIPIYRKRKKSIFEGLFQ